MINIPGYKIDQKIHESASSIIYRAFKQNTQESFIIKTPRARKPTQDDIQRLNFEYEIIKHLNLDGIIKTYGIQHFGNTVALILEYFKAISLGTFIKKGKIDLNTFFIIAVKLAETLTNLHKNNVIHRNINPENILLNTETMQVKITDFGTSSLISQKNQENYDFKILHETLVYISPEQTGRMNSEIDYRTDFYSLGVIFYEMLIGEPPFQSQEPMELIHSHIAKIPVLPHHLRTEIPVAVSEIIMKLLSKNAEARYKSGQGLKYDLEFCQRGLIYPERLINFVPGKADMTDKLQISQKLYGREKELFTILPIYEKARRGSQEIVFINGSQGIGKTRILNEIEKNMLKGYFIHVNFEKSTQEHPYNAVISAFKNLFDRLLTGREDMLQYWKQRLLTELGPFLNVIVGVIPELEFITGKLKVNPSILMLKEALKKLIYTFAGREHFFVIFLDNLQWIDNASLSLFKSLLGENKAGYMLVIGTYTEINPSHPLAVLFEELKKSVGIVKNISILPLLKVDIQKLLEDSFSPNPGKIEELTDLVYHKTQGNPYLIHKLLNSLYQEKLIKFDLSMGYWYWDIADINTSYSEESAQLIVDKINKLSEITQHLLQIAACLGMEFYLKDLVIAYGKSEVETFKELNKASSQGLILIIEDKNRFCNEKIFDVVYESIPEHNKETMHYKIGHLLLQNIKEEEIEDKIFNIVRHFNQGINFIDQRDKNKLAEMSLYAGKKAKDSSLYELALKHFKNGIGFLSKNSWKFEHDLIFSLSIERAECEYLIGNVTDSEEYFSLILKNSTSDYEKSLVNKIILKLSQSNKGSNENKSLFESFKYEKSNDSSLDLDHTTLMLAFQTLSAEIMLDKLLDKLMKIVIENAGAQKGFLILKDKDNLIIEAERSVNMEKTKVFESVRLEDSKSISMAIVNYVARTQQDVVLNNAVNEGLFISDPYITYNKPKSILCIPIIKQSHLIGILYLENNLTTGAFTSERLELLKLISSQAAISLENARLYDEMRLLNISLEHHKNNLEEMVEERTKQLKETQQKLLDSAHQAGMAEIATGVLHNVGNILNSLSVSSEIIIKTLDKSEIDGLTQANNLLSKNIDNIGDFMANSPKGKKLAKFYLSVGEMLIEEHQKLKGEATSLMEKILITKNVVSTQQSYARAGFLIEKVNLGDIVENSLAIQLGSLLRHGIQVHKNFANVPDILVQKTKLLHVLMNIFKNGKEAMEENKLENKILTIEIDSKNNEIIYIKISDNGKGILPEDIDKVFNHGFTTKDEGHGFGLHTCANAMTEMGGSIEVFSEGLGKGATFVLSFPLK